MARRRANILLQNKAIIVVSAFLIAWIIYSLFIGMLVIPDMSSLGLTQEHYIPIIGEAISDYQSNPDLPTIDIPQLMKGDREERENTIDRGYPLTKFPDLRNYTSRLSMYGQERARESLNRLPAWLQEYFSWHAEQRKNPTSETKYIVVSCLKGQLACGGTSDRLRPLPYYLLVASLTRRVLLLKWNKPHDLYHFFMPPLDVDWRILPSFDRMIEPNRSAFYQSKITSFWLGKKCDLAIHSMEKCTRDIVKEINDCDKRFVQFDLLGKAYNRVNDGNLLFQTQSYEGKMPLINQWMFPNLFGDIFRVMFEPVPALAELVNSTMTSLGLEDGNYVSVHVRSRYPVPRMPQKNVDKNGGQLVLEGRTKGYLSHVSGNAIKCGMYLEPDLPIFFASDSNVVSEFALKHSDFPDGKPKIVTVTRLEEPRHTDQDDGWPGSLPADFYSGFEDLLIMGGSKCVAHGVGSFGSFGAGLIGNRCRAIHRAYNGKPDPCPNDRAGNITIPVGKVRLQ